MENNEGKIVVFDSGLGGISVLRQLVRQLPNERFLYFGDSAMAPYGARSTQQVRQLTLAHISRLMDKQTKAVVIACNTATSAAIDALRQRYPQCIIIGIEPALKVAADRFPGGRILVMATEVTLREEKFAKLTERFSRSHRIEKVACPGLVEYVEQGILDGPEIERHLHQLLAPYLIRPVDALVLGCTHYPFLTGVIRRVVGETVSIFDGGEGTATQTRRRLAKAGLLRREGPGAVEFQNSDPSEAILTRARQLLTIEQ